MGMTSSRKLPEKKFSLCQVLFFGAFPCLVSSSPLFASSSLLPCSLSLSLCVCLLEERKIRLTGHTPPPLARVFWSVFSCFLSPFLPFFFFLPVSAVRPSVSAFFRGAFFLPQRFLDFRNLALELCSRLLRPFSRTLVGRALVLSLSSVIFVFPVFRVCGFFCTTRGADPSLYEAYPTGRRTRPSGE